MSYKELFKIMFTIISCMIILTIGLLFLVISIPFVWNNWYYEVIYNPISDMIDNIFRNIQNYDGDLYE